MLAVSFSNCLTMDQKTKLVKKISIDGQEVTLEYKDLPVQLKVDEKEEGVVEAYVSVFGNVDSYGEIVEKGAFAESLKSSFPRYPKFVWAHNWEEPLGPTLEAHEDERGLYAKGKFVLSVQRAREIYELMKAGAITDFSFGYKVDEDVVDENGIRHLKKLTIFEWSPVLVGANPKATLLNVKSVEQVIVNSGNRKIIENIIEKIGSVVSPLDEAKQQLEALLEATEPSPSADEGETAVDQRDRRVIKNLLLRDARQGVKALNKVILRLKKEK